MPTQKEKLDDSVKAYCGGKTRGNWYQSMLVGNYSENYAKHCGSKLLDKLVVQEAIKKYKDYIESWKEGGRALCDRLFSERYVACVGKKDNTNAIRCIENKAKNVGYYALDNAQRTEQVKLTEEQVKEAKEYAKWKLLRGLEEQKLGSELLQESTEGSGKDDNGI